MGLHEHIRVLISTHTSDLDEIERTLTDGYAQVLQLEAEKFRLEKRIAEVAQSLHIDESGERVREISSLAKRVDGSIGELSELRSRLADLRRHADAVRLEAELLTPR